jgi:hypothetical protein
MREHIVRLKLDASPWLEAISSFEAFFHVRNEFLSLPFSILDTLEEFATFENHGAVGSFAGEIWISLKPTKLFRELMATLRAGDRDFSAFIKDHVSPYR